METATFEASQEFFTFRGDGQLSVIENKGSNPLFLKTNQRGEPACRGAAAPKGGESDKNGHAVPFLGGGTASPPSEGEKTRLSAFLRGACRPWGGGRSLRFVPPPGGTL